MIVLPGRNGDFLVFFYFFVRLQLETVQHLQLSVKVRIGKTAGLHLQMSVLGVLGVFWWGHITVLL